MICPGGMGGALTLKDNEAVQRLVLKYYKEGKIVSFICAGKTSNSICIHLRLFSHKMGLFCFIC